MRLELSRSAQVDRDAIRDYSLEQFGALRTIACLDVIEQAFRRILVYPEIGAAYPAAQPPVRSLTCERHRIFHSVGEEAVVVVRVLHAAMDVERHIPP